MTVLQPKEIWQKSNRLETVDVLMKATGANEISKQKSTNEYILGCTHEDVITNLLAEFVQGESELPIQLYQIQSKFRNEARAKSGLMRGREFLMKDLYSFHTSNEDLISYYEIAKKKYIEIFEEFGIGEDTFLTYASGGDFTNNFSHEFQTILETGEDTIYLDRENRIAYNKEVVNEIDAQKLKMKLKDFENLEKVSACEVGNIFPLGLKFSKAFDLKYTNQSGERNYVWMGSYGIGISRLMGVIAEKFNDEKGLIWPENIAPFKYHICLLNNLKSSVRSNHETNAWKFYHEHEGDCLIDDRVDVSAGEKFADTDLIGCPIRVVFSERNPSGEKLNRK